MFAATVVSLFALSALAPSVVAAPSAGLIRNVHRSVPSQFKEREYVQDADLLEPYEKYAARYQEWHCQDQHNTTFWDKCCHPLLKDETLDGLPDDCFTDDHCDDEPTTSHTHAPSTTVVQHTEKPTTSDKPVTSEKPATSDKPTTTEKPEKPATTHSSPPETTSKASGGGGGGDGGNGGSWVTGGFATYYLQNGNYGACGVKHSDDDLIGAIDIAYYGNINKQSSLCGKKARIVNLENGNEVVITVADVCPTCKTDGSFDLSKGAFLKLADNLGVGMFKIKYQLLD